MPDLLLYRKDGASSIAPHMLLFYLDVPFTSIPMKEGANRSYEGADGTNLTREAFHKISPMEYVPALTVNDETIITELSAVLFYISSLKPERGMRRPRFD